MAAVKVALGAEVKATEVSISAAAASLVNALQARIATLHAELAALANLEAALGAQISAEQAELAATSSTQIAAAVRDRIAAQNEELSALAILGASERLEVQTGGA